MQSLNDDSSQAETVDIGTCAQAVSKTTRLHDGRTIDFDLRMQWVLLLQLVYLQLPLYFIHFFNPQCVLLRIVSFFGIPSQPGAFRSSSSSGFPVTRPSSPAGCVWSTTLSSVFGDPRYLPSWCKVSTGWSIEYR